MKMEKKEEKKEKKKEVNKEEIDDFLLIGDDNDNKKIYDKSVGFIWFYVKRRKFNFRRILFRILSFFEN